MWYKVYARFGPGHQGKDTFYRWAGAELGEEDRRELAEEMFSKWHWTEQIKVDVDLVPAIPEDVRDGMIASQNLRLGNAKFMLGILNDPVQTPVTKGK